MGGALRLIWASFSWHSRHPDGRAIASQGRCKTKRTDARAREAGGRVDALGLRGLPLSAPCENPSLDHRPLGKSPITSCSIGRLGRSPTRRGDGLGDRVERGAVGNVGGSDGHHGRSRRLG
jgi:hypothetical protein